VAIDALSHGGKFGPMKSVPMVDAISLLVERMSGARTAGML
jgi:hypothetical protein